MIILHLLLVKGILNFFGFGLQGKKKRYQGEIRPKTGSPYLFPKGVEEDIALFMKHCMFLRIPRTK